MRISDLKNLILNVLLFLGALFLGGMIALVGFLIYIEYFWA